MSYSKSVPERVRLINSQLQLNNLTEDNITELLEALGEPHSKIASKGSKPKIKNNPINTELVKKLEEIDYISSFKENDEDLIVNTKRK